MRGHTLTKITSDYHSHNIYMLFIAQGEFFMVQDVNSRADVLNTTGSYGAPNFRKAKENYPLFGMGQASLNGFKQVLQRLENEAYEVSHYCAIGKTSYFSCVKDIIHIYYISVL